MERHATEDSAAGSGHVEVQDIIAVEEELT